MDAKQYNRRQKRLEDRLIDKLTRRIKLTDSELRRIVMTVKEYFANHWRDDETPEGEYFASRSPLIYKLAA